MRIVRFEKAERFRALNRMAQIVLFATACLMTFLLSWKRLPVLDITKEGRYSLTPETTAYLRALPKEVEIVGSWALGEESSLGVGRLRELQNLTMAYAAMSPRLKVQWVDAFRAQAEFGFKNPYRILLRSADAQVWVSPEELYFTQDEIFLGERALTSALWRLLHPARPKVVIVTASERYNADGSWGFRLLGEFLSAHNAEVSYLSPDEVSRGIPACEAIFVLGGGESLSTEALSVLQRLLNDRKCNLLMAFDEAASEPLVRFLYYNGVVWSGLRVEENEILQKTPLGEALVRDFAPHPVTTALIRDERMVLSRGRFWALEARGATLLDATVKGLLQSSAKSSASEDARVGPFMLMMAVEKKSAQEAASRLLVCGSSDFLANAYLSYRGNQVLMEGIFNWLVNENKLLSIPPRTRAAHQLGMTSVQLWRLGAAILGCSLVLLVIGGLKWMLRPR